MQKYNYIERAKKLIGNFMSGKTTLDEEIWLSSYFRTHDVPEEWNDYKALFAYFDAGMPLGKNENESTEHNVVPIKNRWKFGVQWAAAAAIVIAVCVAAFRLLFSTDVAVQPQPVVAQRQAQEEEPTSRHKSQLTDAVALHNNKTGRSLAQKHVPSSSKNSQASIIDTLVVSPEGVAEYGKMVLDADYDQWLTKIEYIKESAHAEYLIEQGALMALQSDAMENSALKDDIQEVP